MSVCVATKTWSCGPTWRVGTQLYAFRRFVCSHGLMHCDVPVIYSYVLGNREPAAINHVSKTTSPNHVFIKNFKTHGGMSTIWEVGLHYTHPAGRYLILHFHRKSSSSLVSSSITLGRPPEKLLSLRFNTLSSDSLERLDNI